MKFKLQEIVDVTMGQSPKSEFYNTERKGYPFLQGNRTFGFKYPTFDTYTTVMTKPAKAGDVIMSVRAPVGDLNITPVDMCLGRGVCSLRMKNGNQSFLYYMMKYYVPHLLKKESGTVFGSVNRNDINGLEVDIPEDEQNQRRIARYLEMIDEKIELNTAINNNLEQQMQALYKAWFVDFVPFNGIKPTNWIKTDIYSIANIIYGAPFASKLFNTDGIGKPIIRIRDLKEQDFVTFTTEEHPKGHLIHPGDIVVGMDGEFRPYIWGNEKAWLNQRVCIFENKRTKGKAFLFYTIKPLLNMIEQTQVATTVIHIGKKDFDAFEILLPSEDVLNQFDEITTPMVEQIVNNRLENKRLSNLRDALLPKLMSGELDVSDIDL
jgi:type I restriction enzyme S subunit